ncbi:hypothetical protein [Haloprofundus salinisoli]|uniref:hypothetical protein n=1 Tax=Haloprofundus salinisoli TaxID=2876193 RepID=UPI001CCFB6F1|nr:hypothetical protein [Haloprofundus salinisoli]
MNRREYLAISGTTLISGCTASQGPQDNQSTSETDSGKPDSEVIISSVKIWNKLDEQINFDLRIFIGGEQSLTTNYDIGPGEQLKVDNFPHKGESFVIYGSYNNDKYLLKGYDNSLSGKKYDSYFLIKENGDLVADGTNWDIA